MLLLPFLTVIPCFGESGLVGFLLEKKKSCTIFECVSSVHSDLFVLYQFGGFTGFCLRGY